MASRAKVIGLGASLPTVIVLAHGCKGPTELTVDLRTNVVCADQRGIDIVAASDAHEAEDRAALLAPGTVRFPSATTNDCADGPAPRSIGTLVLTPSGESGAVVVVSAFGNATLADCTASRFAPQCIVARRRFAFIDGKQLVLPIVLDPECAGVPCNESSTCVGKKCVDSAVDCSGGTCAPPGVAPDGGLIEVDGASPLVDGSSSLDGDATDQDGSDASGGDGGPGDAKSGDGNSDAGDAASANGCTNPRCVATTMGTASICAGSGQTCCYDPTSATPTGTCTAATNCNAPLVSACCRGADDCTNGDICCASTATYGAGTQFRCMPAVSCTPPDGTGVIVCTQDAQGCQGLPYACKTGSPPYSSDPTYFFCGS